MQVSKINTEPNTRGKRVTRKLNRKSKETDHIMRGSSKNGKESKIREYADTRQKIMKKIIEEYTGNNKWSYGGVGKILKAFDNKIKRKDVVDALKNVPVYTINVQKKRSGSYSPIYVYNRRELWQIDIVFFTDKSMKLENDGYKYMLTCIDCFTKFTWGKALKSTKCKEAMQALESILTSTLAPKKIYSDHGNEFKCDI